jgi:cobaltochelatase CobS
MSVHDDILKESMKAIKDKGVEVAPPPPPKEYFDGIGEHGVGHSGNLFSDVYGYTPDSGIDHNTKLYEDTDWPEDVRLFIPEPTNHIFPKEETEEVVVGIDNQEPVNITGPAGTGKSTLIKEIAARRRQPFVRISGKDGLELSSLIGEMIVQDGATVWKDGILTQGVKTGALVCVDEVTKMHAGVNMVFQWLLEPNGKLMLEDMPGDTKDKMITPHPDFRIVFTDNVKGLGDNMDKYAATNVQDISMISRFGVNVSLGYQTSAVEENILMQEFKMTPVLAKDMVQLASKIREGYNNGQVQLSMSIRTLLKWAKWCSIYKDPQRGFNIAFRNALADDCELSFVDNLYRAVFDGNTSTYTKEDGIPF